MAQRGRPRKENTTITNILNGDVGADTGFVPSPRRRKTFTAAEDGNGAKRRATERPAETSNQAPKPQSTRLSRPRISEERRRADGTGMQRQDVFEPPNSPQQTKEKGVSAKRLTNSSQKTKQKMTSMKSRGKPIIALEPNDVVFDNEEGEEDAANPLMTSPAANTRSHGKNILSGISLENRGLFTTHAQPADRPQRPQRRLRGKAPEVDPHILHSIQSTPGEALADTTSVGRNATYPTRRMKAFSGSNDKRVDHKKGAREEAQKPATQEDEIYKEDVEDQDNEGDEVGQEEQDEDESEQGEQGADLENQGASPTHNLSIFDEPRSLFGCKDHWDNLLNAIRENQKHRANLTSEIEEVHKTILKAKRQCRRIMTAEGDDTEEQELVLADSLEELTDQVKQLQPTGNTVTDRRLDQDINQLAIPRLVLLLKAVLVTRFHEGVVSRTTLEELAIIIEAALDLCAKAVHWKALPTKSQDRISRESRVLIKLCLEGLQRAYEEAAGVLLVAENKRSRLKWQAALAEDNAKWLAEQRKKKELAAHNEIYHSQSRNGKRMQASIIDIEDLALFSPSKVSPRRTPGPTAVRRSIPVRVADHGRIRGRPRSSREHTEDIPGPMAREWTNAEDIALLEGLERFTSADRFYDIDNVYGSREGPLSSRDMDELMQRAAFYKQSMASHIEDELEQVGDTKHWAWLLSVDD